MTHLLDGRPWLAPALFVALLVLAPLVPGGYVLYIATLVLIYTLASFGTNILTGYTNLISMAGAVFFGIGAYGTAILTQQFGVPMLLAMLIAAAIATVVGLVLALPVLRLEEVFLAIATLGFVMISVEIAKSGGDLTGGENGMGAPGPTLFGLALDERAYHLLAACVLGAALWLARNLARSRFGRGFLAIKGSETAARALGLNTTGLKLVAFGVCAFYTGLSGALYAPLVRFIDPSLFNIMVSISFVSMVIVGGLGSILGSVLGAIFVIGAPQLLTYFGFDQFQRALYGVAMILALMFLPDGLASLFKTRRLPGADAPGKEGT
ncbi:branched-chain amino acid transport system permease protein [Pseudacidovorax sp. 1753]|uniref:branched-chain amino acid ABC transporter permease n=1 Tax=unclassified Pseudacidovorax TaxID=2620592 RepID=UPI001B457D9F|nr:branched-chain amino acid ABC transporter permease [Pseudacidovorax sp.]MBP6897401.1 branched-chain amino acid ABC transporter permease [Pseudacidovorax sp.]